MMGTAIGFGNFPFTPTWDPTDNVSHLSIDLLLNNNIVAVVDLVPGAFPLFLPFTFSVPLSFFEGTGTTSFGVSLISASGGTLMSTGIGTSIHYVYTPFVIPAPIAGTGLPSLILAGAGLLGWWRRRQKSGAG